MQNSPESNRHRRRHIAFIAGNFIFAALMLGSIPFIRQGESGFRPFTELDKEYVHAVIADGRPEAFENALKKTEVARAVGYQDHVATLELLQFAAVAMALLFLVNTFLLFRMMEDRKRAPAIVAVS